MARKMQNKIQAPRKMATKILMVVLVLIAPCGVPVIVDLVFEIATYEMTW